MSRKKFRIFWARKVFFFIFQSRKFWKIIKQKRFEIFNFCKLHHLLKIMFYQ